MAPLDAIACTPINYDTSAITAQSMAQDMVDDAASIEVMRAVSRIRVPAHPYYADSYGPIYEYRLEPVEVLHGRSPGVMSFTAPDVDWLDRRVPGTRRYYSSREPLWWLTPRGYEDLQRTSIYLPHDFHSTTCASAVMFEIDAEYLVFRGADGRLLSPGLTGELGTPQRPVLERVLEKDDPWLAAVRDAIERTPHGVARR